MTTVWIAISNAIIAAGAASFLFLKKQCPGKLEYQWNGRVIVDKEKEELPADIVAALREASSPHVCCNEIVLWNAGEHTILGSDIDPAEPLRNTAWIKDLQTRSATNDAISFLVNRDVDRTNVAFCGFDFLAPGEGVRLQAYETGVC